MEISEMEQLVDLVKRSNVRELTLRNGESRITLKKDCFSSAVEVGGDLVPYRSPEESSEEYVQVESNVYAEYSAQPEDDYSIEAVTAPLVGIFHHIKPHIGPGAHVSSGQVVAVIEAMKLITEVTSPKDGVIVEAVIEDGMPAEYGQTLFLVKTEQ